MFRKIFSPNQYVFWILTGILPFLFFYKTLNDNKVDIVHLSKLAILSALIIYALSAIILVTKFDIQLIKNDRSLQIILAITVIYSFWITLTNTVFSSAPSYTLLGWDGWYSGYLLYILCILCLTLPIISRNLSGFHSASQILFWFSVLISTFSAAEFLGFNVLLTSSFAQRVVGYEYAMNTASFPVLSVGNSGYIAAIWLILLPWPLISMLQTKEKQAFLWWLALSLGLAATHSKISIILATAFFLVLCTKYALQYHKKYFVFFLINALITWFGSPLLVQVNSSLYEHHIVSRESIKGFDVGKSFGDRLYIWEGALNASKNRIVTGWGLETLQSHYFDYVSQTTLSYYGKIYLHQNDTQKTLNFGNLLVLVSKNGGKKIILQGVVYITKPHNYFIEELYSNGLIGLVLLLVLFTSIYMYCFKSGSNSSKLILVGFGMYLIYLCGWFITIAVSPLAFILLGFAVHLAAKKRAEDRQALLDVKAPAIPDTA